MDSGVSVSLPHDRAMSREIIKRNDEARIALKGVTVLMSPSLMEIEPFIRGRLIHRISIFDSFHPESDHSEGVLIFAGFSVYWYIDDTQRDLRLHIEIS
jgi:hypothetical protein